MIFRRRTVAAFCAFLCLGVANLPAFAQTAPAARVRGTIEKFEGGKLSIKTDDGASASFTLAPDAVITTSKPASLNDIKSGDFVASAAMMGEDGKLHSTELRIFPEALRGAGEGQRPMDQPNRVMTNATVSEVVAAPAGRVLKVKFKQGTSELVVDPGVKITAIVAADAGILKPGTVINITATKAADGSMIATRIGTN